METDGESQGFVVGVSVGGVKKRRESLNGIQIQIEGGVDRRVSRARCCCCCSFV